MKNFKFRIVLLVVVCGLLVAFAGCQQAQDAKIGDSIVTLIKAEEFPPHMVGVWRNASQGWIVMFDEDGRVLRMTHTIARTNLKAGEVATFPMLEGEGTVVPGQWSVEYDGGSNKLALEINLESYDFNFLGNNINGSSKDIFIGTVPEQGETIWRAHWISFQNYIATTADESHVDYVLPQLPGDEDKGEIVFEKVDIEQLRQQQDHH